ncbi:MAG TPA: bleomycin resistance family protein [Gemmatimonadales bacterium]|nr:bleomycin resistance family protein [Gemmatimonadales bacterium]
MRAHDLTPILNVSNLATSFAWFERFGWRKKWEWGEPPDFGCVASGACEIFLCVDGQGGRGKGSNTRTFGPEGNESRDQGAWMSVWVEDVDALHVHCQAQGLDITFGPMDMEWGVRELHVRHPDGHVFRMSQGLAAK